MLCYLSVKLENDNYGEKNTHLQAVMSNREGIKIFK